jgi:hypothetical protein
VRVYVNFPVVPVSVGAYLQVAGHHVEWHRPVRHHRVMNGDTSLHTSSDI